MDTPIIINVETNRNFKTGEIVPRSSLYGIEEAKYLRRADKVKNPIIFTSFLLPNDILAKPNTTILTAIGHYYLQLPYSQEELNEILKEVTPLNEIQLKDVILNFCQLRSSVRESFHAFKGRVREINNKRLPFSDKIEPLRKEFDDYEAELRKDVSAYPEIIKEYQRIISLLDEKNENSLEFIMSVQEETFVSFLPADEDTAIETTYEKKPWKVLFLDDRPDELKIVLSILDERKIKYNIAHSSAEAKNLIEQDETNQFAVVVTDYRLFESNTEEWLKPRLQKEQGYDFLLWLSKQNRFNAMVALSGLSKWFLMDSFRHHQINVKVYSKNGLMGGGEKLFVDDIEHLGHHYFEILASQPQAATWSNDTIKQDKITNYALKRYYVYHRSQPEYLSIENSINSRAEKVARELEAALDKDSNFTFASMVSIQGNATKTMKGNLEEEYEDFQTKLLQRRIFLYMLLKGFERDSISKLLHKGDSEHEMTESMIKQIPSMLAIQTEKDLPYNILVEEKYFLQHYMSLPLFEVAELMDQSFILFNHFVNQYIRAFPDLLKELRNYVTENTGELKTVSMMDTHLLLKKVCNLLVLRKQTKEAIELINGIEDIALEINRVMPNFQSFKKPIEEITKIKSNILKKS